MSKIIIYYTVHILRHSVMMCRQQLCNKLMALDLMSFKGGVCTIHLHLVC